MADQTVAPTPSTASFALTDRYEVRIGRVHLTGIQALARLPLDQARRDRAAGNEVGTYISGYEGSPLAGYDLELGRQSDLLDDHGIVFEPALNEEAAAMAVQGTQLVGELDATVSGVTGYWYGKAPGLDRATDALRHANLMGTSPTGGVVALVGDDPGAKSSSVPCASERALADLAMPTLYPADPGEILTLGRHAIALSRACGLWSALKIVTAVADGSAAVDLESEPPAPRLPAGSGHHEPTAKLLQPTLGPLERDFMTTRMRIATAYADLNGLNEIIAASPADRIGIVTAGKTYLDVREALDRLGFGDGGPNDATVRLLKLGMIWPLDESRLRAFAEGLDTVIVVEEKRAFLETAVREALYDVESRPRIVGKRDAGGAELFAAYGELNADTVTRGLARVFDGHSDTPGVTAWLEQRRAQVIGHRPLLPLLQRSPYYCSGCPHNTSTRPHTDSPVGAGIGCHAMVLLMDSSQVGQVLGLTQMGGEGTQWLGMAPFVKNPHLAQNLGDGTFHHSGSLAIRAAVASGRNITYRVLYNSTVAMTGGQDAVGQLSIAAMVRSLRAEGVAAIIVTSDDPRALRKAGVAKVAEVWSRDRIAEAEQRLSTIAGTTVLIHEQECATELRRKRKRGSAPRPRRAIAINERLCEGCGDCGEKSNCLSVHPVETEFGRKTRIHQSSCNLDATCLEGDCPAFMTIEPGTAAPERDRLVDLETDDLPEPPPSGPVRRQSLRLMGIGGTGVVTTSQIVATAAVLSGRYVRTLDQTGLAQKGGAVVSDVKIDTVPIDAANQVGDHMCDLYLGYDLLVATDERHLRTLTADATAVVSTSTVPTGAMVSDKTVSFPPLDEAVNRIEDRLPAGRLLTLDARHYAETLFGAEQFANLFLLGIALQAGALRLSAAAVEEAIVLNGVAIETNTQAFRRGRQFVTARADLEAAVAARRDDTAPAPLTPSAVVAAEPGSELERLVAQRRHELVAYQDETYARRYEDLVEATRRAEVERIGRAGPLSEAVARYAFKLMAYKDEYEVARLALDAEEARRVTQTFGVGAKIQWRLHPPLLRALGLNRKIAVGRWFTPAFWALHRLRRLRGTMFDPFSYAQVRRVERTLVDDYERTIEQCLEALGDTTHEQLVRIAELPDLVRGYEDVKLRSVTEYRDRLRTELAALTASHAL